MSFYVNYRIKAEGVDEYVPIKEVGNITYNVGKIIRKSTGLEWDSEGNNGLCIDIIPCIEKGLKELREHTEAYRTLEAPNGWGTVEGTIHFFEKLISAWEEVKREYPLLVPLATFWID